MGQKINPVGFRLGIVKGWDSSWYGGKEFSDKLVEDQKIRKYIAARIPKGAIARVVIERTLKRITLTIHTARPGIVIGKGGGEVDKIKEELKKITGKDVQINIFEIKRPEIDAKLVGEAIAQQLEARISFRRAMKQAIQSAIRVGAQGIKVKGVRSSWVVLKLPAQSSTKKAVCPCTPSVLTLITPCLKPRRYTVRSVSKCGSLKANSTASVICRRQH